FAIIEEACRIAKATKKTPAQVALAWLLRDKRVSSVIIGGRKPEQVKENCLAGSWQLPRKYHEKLAGVTGFDPGYPQSWIDRFGMNNLRNPAIEQ
ncbi:MAG: hypothetical protein GF350_00830, partial [Chitinivibrionales bacterium]|nr:hypothetical protein [Chitinivibrionales bacterium]